MNKKITFEKPKSIHEEEVNAEDIDSSEKNSEISVVLRTKEDYDNKIKHFERTKEVII